MRKLLGLALLVLAGCDSQSGGDLDVGDFDGTFAGARARGGAFHDATGARASAAEAVTVRMDLSVEDDDGGYRTAILMVRVPLAATAGASDVAVGEGAEAELVEFQGGAPVVLETATAGLVRLAEPEGDREWPDLKGRVEALAFPSGTVAGTFRAVDEGAPTPQSRCDARGCVYY